MSQKGLPIPRPPKKKKCEIFEAKNFEYIDSHAQEVSPALLQRSVKQLVTFLTRPAQTDVGKVRALFRWAASVDMTSLQRPEVIPPVDSTISFLFRIKERKSNHASLFSTLCREAKLPCVKIQGFGKNSRYQIGSEIDPARMRTQWNAVVVDGEWRLVDVLWASTAVVRRKPRGWTVAESSKHTKGREGGGQEGEQQEEDEEDQEATAHKINDFFFLTDPEAFIYTHLPEDSKWQLLPKKVTAKDFEMLPYLRERFFDMGVFMNDDSHPKCVLETVDPEVFIHFGLHPAESESADFQYLLHRGKDVKSKGNPSDVNDNTVNLDKAVSLTKYPDELRLNLHLPLTGRYKLDVFGRDPKMANCTAFDLMCSYVVDYQQASTAHLQVLFLFPVPSEHARFLRRGGASDWLKRKDATLKVAGHELVISFAMPTGTNNAKRFLSDFENRHQVVPPVIRSLLQIIPKEFNLDEAHDVKSGHKEWKVGIMNIEFLSQVNGLVRTPDGNAVIKLGVNAETEVWYEFHEDNPTKGVPKEAIKLISKTEGGRTLLSFKVSVKKPMTYKLNVFSRSRLELNKFYHVKTFCVEYELLDFV